VKRHELKDRIRRYRRMRRKKLAYLERWINLDEVPHPFVRYALDIPRTIEEAIDEAREISHSIWKDPDEPQVPR